MSQPQIPSASEPSRQSQPPSELPANLPAHAGSRSAAVWIGLSFGLSATILVAAFSIPFRRSSVLVGTATPSPEASAKATGPSRSDTAAAPLQRSLESAEAIRRAAIATDQTLMKSLRTQRVTADAAARPGIEQTRQYWAQQSQRVRAELQLLSKAPEGSAQWQYCQDLLRWLADGPHQLP